MADLPDQAKLAEADKLTIEARETGESTSHGIELRLQAAKLRVEALGGRSYPILICSECLELTGWTTGDGKCDSCLRRAQTEAAFADPHGGFVVLDDIRQGVPPSRPPERGGPGLLGRLLGGRAVRERAHAAAWLSHVDPDQTGPIEPEVGYELEVAHRDQLQAADQSCLLIQFRTATHRFTDDAWLELETTRADRDRLVFPTEQSAALPAEQLVDAWLDYQAAVTEFNRGRWAEQSAAGESARIAREGREEALREQEHSVELLDES